jgi:hypothetical protein
MKQDFTKIVPKNKIDDSIYRPQTSKLYVNNQGKFEGYFQFPRPLSKPFFNVTLPKHDDKERFFSSLKETLKIDKNIEQFDKLENQGIPYFTSSLAISDNTSKAKVIKSIDDYIVKFKEKNKYKLDLVKKDPKIKALKRVKKMLMENDGDMLINGRRIQKPNESMVKRLQEISNKRKTKRKKSAEPVGQLDNNEKDELSFRIIVL